VRICRWLIGFALAAMAVGAVPASATFHLVKIREVYPAGTASYVMLQMLATGENQVHGHRLVAYHPNGSTAHEFFLPNDVSPTSRTNATILITGSGYASAFPSDPTTDELDIGLNLSPSGGAVCWFEGEPPDCVAWGNFTGPLPEHVPPLIAGTPVSPGGVTAGKALHRTIAPGCPTLLQADDDTDDSATDFSEQTPHPRSNADPVEESACVVAAVTLVERPKNPTNAQSASFTYTSSTEGADFECRLDNGTYAICSSEEGFKVAGPLPDGSHTFQVRGGQSGVPATYTWIVDTQPPTAAITSQPANPSSGANVAFTYSSSQLGSTFECSLAPTGAADGFASCPAAGKTYSALADGTYTFRVRSTDKAGNLGAPAAYTWTVNNSLAVVPAPPLLIPPPVVLPPPVTKPPPPLRCKKRFVKKKVKGKMRCVKKKKKRKRR
jgi:hypothetical protein